MMPMVDARTATAADFDAAAQRNAHAFWVYAIVAGLVWWLASIWWAAFPAALALWCVYTSVGATMAARELRKGSYRVPNPNNGAPDGDATNWPGR
jgi:hypothetical protein